MVNQHYRWDFIGLSTDEKPTPETSEKVVDGSTFYESDTSKLYVFCKTQWYEKQATGGGGGSSVNVVQSTGDSTTDVMSQKAVSDMVFIPNSNNLQVRIGGSSTLTGTQGTLVGSQSNVSGVSGVALGGNALVTSQNGVAFAQGKATVQGEFNVGTSNNWSSGGYKGTAFRVIRDVHDGEQAHDAVTIGQINALIDAINSATNANISHIGS